MPTNPKAGRNAEPCDTQCRVDINIESHGDVNIFNCTTTSPRPEP